MREVDVVMTYILCTTFLFLSAILCINLFIALLSNTFQRWVRDKAGLNFRGPSFLAAFIYLIEEPRLLYEVHSRTHYSNPE